MLQILIRIRDRQINKNKEWFVAHMHMCVYVWTYVHKHGHIKLIYYCESLFYRYNSQSDTVMNHYTARNDFVIDVKQK